MDVHKNEQNEEFESSNESEAESTHKPTMEELLKLQEKIGTKSFAKGSMKELRATGKKSISKRKNQPIEMPLKGKYNKLYLENSEIKNKSRYRDPRFDDLSGKLDLSSWRKNYSFLEEKRLKELKMLKNQFCNEKNEFKKEKLKTTIQRIENQNRESKKLHVKQEFNKQKRDSAINSFKTGKVPNYSSYKNEKILNKLEQFENLKKDKKISKYLERKEKKLRANEFKNK